ncbi:MAG TPA: alkaline phosphatase family protein [Bacillota bacterium]|mgnify:CR=1 FL=1|nr:peptidase [Bacillota bacterium]HOA34671.1 alkaline phosphatase family protein [Bacillota bacterium]HOJ83229.1 alkaline phosphatase family protein [Bacillota bacterium]HOL15158.1 alkaline phosphatase family protein [Bacillota bacterium]HPZ11380.1 alkaline phosphatase family protein [Bacillota bacterium]
MRVIFIFVDGVGLGEPAPENPFTFTETPFLRTLLQGNPLTREMSGFHDEKATLRGIDARLGVEGLPQSASGQAALFTGTNAPGLLGYHLNGFPNPTLRRLLTEKGIFALLRDEGYRCAFVNAYRPAFFEQLEEGLPGRRHSCSTLITYYGGLPFYNLEDLKAGKALYMDLTNELLQRMGFSVPQITPEEAGKRLADIGREFDFSLFEYFLSDYAGHLASREEAGKVITSLDRFLGAVVESLDPEQTLLILTSDHGNLEDLSHSRHTLNEVPALLIGAEAVRRKIAPRLCDLTDLLPAVREALDWKGLFYSE